MSLPNKHESRLKTAVPSDKVMFNDKPECFANHLGIWAIEPKWFKEAISAVQSGVWTELKAQDIVPQAPKSFVLTQDGIAVIPIDGQMMKGASKFGGASTIRIRRLLREASEDADVEAIMLLIDSPGGSVAGTAELADDIRSVDENKPVFAHIDDLGASAAFWIASQARQITANRTALIGSIGVLNILVDSSELAKREGLKVHVISTGASKGSGIDGTEITEDVIDEVQTIVDDVFVHFAKAIMQGRDMGDKAFAKVSDGKVHIAIKAKKLGLIDGISSFGDALLKVAHDINASKHVNNDKRRRRAEAVSTMIKLAEF